MEVKQKIGKNLIDIDWLNDLHELQPDNIKIPINYDKLKQSLINNGFAFPFAVWNDGEKYFAIDGHTRKMVLSEMVAEGIKVPNKLKAFEVIASDRTEAIKILLEVYNQKGNPIDEIALTDWLEVEEIIPETIDIESLNVYVEKKEKTDYEDDEEDDDEEENTKASGHGLFPLAVVLTKKDYTDWQNFKKTYGVRGDTEAFIKLFTEQTVR